MLRVVCARVATLLQVTAVVAFSASPSSLPNLAANPNDAAATALLGDDAYRKSDFDSAEAFYRLALSTDPVCTRALWGLGRIAELNFHRGTARDYYAAAFRLDPRNPQIIRSYASVVTDRDAQAILWKNYIAAGGDQSALWPQPADILASPYRSYSLPMSAYHSGSARPAGMLLHVSINGGKPLKLIFDTGARGVVIRAGAAEKLNLEFLGLSLVRGVGDGKPSTARIALAKSVDIDDLRMQDCVIEVADALPLGDADGVIGATTFHRFLIRFNARKKLLVLSPFPGGLPERPWHGHNREVLPDLQSFTHAFQVGHLLLVRAGINQSKSGYFALDTGSAFSALTSNLAQPNVLAESATRIYGVSGWVSGTVRISPVQFQFAREAIIDPDAIAFDLRQMSRQEGVEISGVIGYSTLSRGVLTIDYRDGLVDFTCR